MRLLKAGLALSLSFAFGLVLPSAPASAQVRYEASISDTKAVDWSTRSSRISCILSYNINGYGRADFVLLSGSQRKLSLELFPSVEISNKSKMRIISAPPEWKPQGLEADLGAIDLFRGFRPFVGDSVSWSMLRELNRGQRIMFPYMNSNPNFSENIVPVLSPIGFSKPYKEFLDCNGQLLPVGYADVGLIALIFYEKEDRLTPTSEARLKSQIEYAKLDTALSKVIISSFGSGNADNLENIKLAKYRGESIAEFFEEAGIPKEKIEIRTYGDEQLATSGYTAADRQQSSKAIVELERDTFKVDRRQEVDMPDVGLPPEWVENQ